MVGGRVKVIENPQVCHPAAATGAGRPRYTSMRRPPGLSAQRVAGCNSPFRRPVSFTKAASQPKVNENACTPGATVAVSVPLPRSGVASSR